MYVKIELADERYCDGCPLCFDAACRADMGQPTIKWGAAVPVQLVHWIRPQACIDASRDIQYTLESYDIEMGYHEAR